MCYHVFDYAVDALERQAEDSLQARRSRLLIASKSSVEVADPSDWLVVLQRRKRKVQGNEIGRLCLVKCSAT